MFGEGMNERWCLLLRRAAPRKQQAGLCQRRTQGGSGALGSGRAPSSVRYYVSTPRSHPVSAQPVSE